MNLNRKYRIYNPHSNKMLYDIDNVFECLKQQIKHDKTMPDRGFIVSYDHYSEGMRWMMSLNKKDSNGKEIFVGDICILWCDSHSEKLGTANSKFLVFIDYDEIRCKFVLKGLKEHGHLSWNFNDTDFNGKPFYKEIIGNIYQNKNLI